MPQSIALNIDCMEYMKDIPDKHFALAIVDPPYGIGCDAFGMSRRAYNSLKFRNYKGKQWQGGRWDKEPETKEYFIELKRISKNQIIWGANHFIENIPDANSSCWLVWKKNGQNQNATNADCELAYSSFDTAVRFFNYDWCGFGYINQGENKIHPTQKPITLYSWILKNYAKQNDNILDTHLGSGSSRIACHKAGYDFVGCEIDKDYFDAQEKRFNDYLKQIPMEFTDSSTKSA
jgi:site-specific DNA-methyltransferase (adenine-specific)